LGKRIGRSEGHWTFRHFTMPGNRLSGAIRSCERRSIGPGRPARFNACIMKPWFRWNIWIGERFRPVRWTSGLLNF
jgi:hypothetical protein